MTQMYTVGKANTSVKETDKAIVTRYHSTDVVTYNKETKEVTLDTGGWRSVTTKVRMNQTANQFNLNFSVYQSDHEWYVDVNGKTLKFADSEITFTIK